MAEIRKITPRAALSDFRQVTPQAGGVFRALAATAQAASEFLEPIATKQLEDEYTALGREESGGVNYGAPQGRASSSSSAGTQPSGDFDWYKYAVGGAAARPDSFSKLNPEYASRVQQMILAADAELGPGALKITSAYRSNELQGQLFSAAVGKYGSEAAARKWVAPPGRSKHNSGEAVDFADASGSMLRDPNSREAQWIKANAGRFGLDVPMSWEPWQVELTGSRGKSSSSSSSGSAEPAPEPVTVRTKSGKLESRLFSPAAGPMLQKANAAAGVAYVSDKMMQASIDMMNLSNDFELDPEGFMTAAQGYMDGVVEDAPDLFREEIRGQVEREAQRRFLGMMEEKQSDISQRAANSSQALIERWSDDYVDALASGNMTEAAAAEDQLRGLLSARETIAGLSWTKEQSENVVIKSRERAEVAKREAQKAVNDDYTDKLKLIIKAKEAGEDTAFDSILDDPAAEAANPELYREARAKSYFKSELPSFTGAPPAERAAAIADLEANPISEEYQLDILKAARDADAKVRTDFEKDPIAAAAKYLPTDPPPPLPSDFTDPTKVTKALEARAAYARKLVTEGYSPYLAGLSVSEAESLGAIMGKDTPPEMRAAMAGMIVQGFGPDAGAVFKQMKSDDPVTMYGGMLMAGGGSQSVVMEAFAGQALLDEGLVEPPQKATIAAVSPEMAVAMQSVSGAEAVEGGLMKLATAIYATNARGIDPASEESKDLMKAAINKALGASTDPRGRATGGVQEIAGHQVYLPIGLSGEVLNEALERGFKTEMSAMEAFGSIWGSGSVAQADVWGPAGVGGSAGSPPMLEGKPMSDRYFQSGEMKLIPVTKDVYRMEIHRPGGGVLFPRDASGNVYIFDVKKLAGAP
jgi:hypothetical protein